MGRVAGEIEGWDDSLESNGSVAKGRVHAADVLALSGHIPFDAFVLHVDWATFHLGGVQFTYGGRVGQFVQFNGAHGRFLHPVAGC